MTATTTATAADSTLRCCPRCGSPMPPDGCRNPDCPGRAESDGHAPRAAACLVIPALLFVMPAPEGQKSVLVQVCDRGGVVRARAPGTLDADGRDVTEVARRLASSLPPGNYTVDLVESR